MIDLIKPAQRRPIPRRNGRSMPTIDQFDNGPASPLVERIVWTTTELGSGCHTSIDLRRPAEESSTMESRRCWRCGGFTVTGICIMCGGSA